MSRAFFSSEGDDTEDGAVYAFEAKKIVSTADKQNPFDIKEPQVYMPDYLNPRVQAQDGLFTIQPDPTIEFRADGLERVEIDRALKPQRAGVGELN